MVARKKINLKRGEKIRSKEGLNRLSSFYRCWKSKVIINKQSIYNRTLNLQSALRKMHLLKAIGDLGMFRDLSLQKKALLSQHFYDLELVIARRNKQFFFDELRREV